MPVYYVIPITQQNPQCSAAHLPFIQRDENIYSPIADRHAFFTPCTSGGGMNIIEMKYTQRKTIQPNRGESAPGILSQTKPEIAAMLCSVAKLRARTVNWRRSIAIKR